jgi:hypothetical protein
MIGARERRARHASPRSGPALGQGERGTRSRPLTSRGPLAASRYVFCMRIYFILPPYLKLLTFCPVGLFSQLLSFYVRGLKFGREYPWPTPPVRARLHSAINASPRFTLARRTLASIAALRARSLAQPAARSLARWLALLGNKPRDCSPDGEIFWFVHSPRHHGKLSTYRKAVLPLFGRLFPG